VSDGGRVIVSARIGIGYAADDEVCHAAFASVMVVRGALETTNRKAGRFRRRRLFAASSSLNALRFIAAMLPLW
jgi:hypothetical protein